MKLFYDIDKIKRFNRDEKIINEQGEEVLAYDNDNLMELLEQSFLLFLMSNFSFMSSVVYKYDFSKIFLF